MKGHDHRINDGRISDIIVMLINEYLAFALIIIGAILLFPFNLVKRLLGGKAMEDK